MKVYIIGAGLTKFGEHWDKSFRSMMIEAGARAIEESRIEGNEIEALFGGTMAAGRLIGQEHIGALLADQLGLNPIPAIRVEAACASGGVALRLAYQSIKAGIHNIVAVGGVEKMTELSTEDVTFALGGAGDEETELFHGATFPALYALLARAHMHSFGTTEEQLAMVAVKNHKNAVHNPYAQFNKEVTIEEVLNSPYVAEPLKLLDCSPITDGAACIILANENIAKELKRDEVEIIASAQASDTLALAQRKRLTELAATRIAATEAYKQAKISAEDVDIAEVHDCFTIAEILAIEDLGFFEKGTGGKVTEEGLTELNSKITINSSGGLKAAGHPVGATGIKQAIEIYWQLLQKAGKRQVYNADVGLTHNVGGTGATAVVHIMKRR